MAQEQAKTEEPATQQQVANPKVTDNRPTRVVERSKVDEKPQQPPQQDREALELAALEAEAKEQGMLVKFKGILDSALSAVHEKLRISEERAEAAERRHAEFLSANPNLRTPASMQAAVQKRNSHRKASDVKVRALQEFMGNNAIIVGSGDNRRTYEAEAGDDIYMDPSHAHEFSSGIHGSSIQGSTKKPLVMIVK